MGTELLRWFLKLSIISASLIAPVSTQSDNGSAIVDCNFDNQTICNWETEPFSLYKFTFTSRDFNDHTQASGQGHPLNADASFTPGNVTLRLTSSSIPPTTGLVCFTFWYYVNKVGLSDLSLSLLKPTATLNIWQVDNEEVNRWRVASINLASNVSFKLLFNVTVGKKYDGSVGLDDLKLNLGPCTRKDVFDFESSNQGFTRMYDNEFDWQLKTASETNVRNDHTNMSPYGKLMYVNLANQSVGYTSSALTGSFPPANEECLLFWYIKLGSNLSTFQVFINQEIQGAGLELQGLWAVEKPVSSWTQAYVDITSNVPYRIGFQVVVGSNVSKDEVFLDDVRFSTTPCPQKLDCDFEGSFLCGYQSSNSGNIFWHIMRANDPNSVILVDHTTGSGLGSYMQVDFPYRMTNTLTIDLISQFIPPVEKRCLTLWYASKGTGNFRIFLKTNSKETLLLLKAVVDDLKDRQEKTWHYLETDITDVNDVYQVAFQIEGFPWSSFAIDDIKAVGGSCKDLHNGTVGDKISVKPALDPTLVLSGCDFEDGTLCNFTHGDKQNFDWKLFTRNSTHANGTGLDFDSTLNSKFGKHIYMDSLGQRPSSIAQLVTANFTTYDACVSFWYGMSGVDVDRLTAYVRRPGQYDTIVWTRTGNAGHRWVHQMLTLAGTWDDKGNQVPMQVIFEGVVGQTAASDIDLDDIWIYNQQCPPSDVCDFEDTSSCSIDQDNMDDGDWTLNQKAGSVNGASALSSDHTYQTGEGHYALKTFSGTRNGYRSRILLPLMVVDSVQCLTFWYFINSPSIFTNTHILRVLVKDERGIENVVAKLTGRDLGDWTPAHITVPDINTEKIQFMFESESAGNFGSIGVDDIQISSEECYKTVNCRFESGDMCNWHQDATNPTPPWQAEQSASDPNEFYMSVKFSREPDSIEDISAVVSEIISNTTLSMFCFSFHYKMIGQNVGYLNVSLLDDTQADQTKSSAQIFSVHGNHGNQSWQTVSVQKPDNFTAGLFKFVIAATSAKKSGIKDTSSTVTPSFGEILVTDIQLSPQKCFQERFQCASNQTTIDFSKVCDFRNDCPDSDDETNCGTCNFESGFCQWLDDSSGSSHFKLGSTADRGHLPADNHGSDGGDYLFVQGTPSSTQEYVDLVLTRELGPSPPSCYLHFHYFMNAEPNIDLGDLLLVLEEQDEETILWRGLRFPSPLWHEANVAINNIHSRFKIHFRVKKLAYQQFVALDQVEFKGCTFKDNVNLTCDTTSQFKCQSSGSCIDSFLVCDFNQDCFDASDEDENLCRTFIMDDFEQSLGNWRQSTDDVLDWSRYQGQGVQLYNGPRRDHTLGTHFGHYMLFEANGRGSNKKARLLSPIFSPTQGCSITFNLYMYGASSADFRLTTRTTQDGPEIVLLEITEGFDDSWQMKRISLKSNENFQVVLEGITTGMSSLNIALDDISFTPKCQLAANQRLPLGIPTTTVAPKCPVNMFTCKSGHVQCVNQSQVCDFIAQCEDKSDERECGSCDFEVDGCGWHDESIGNKMWTTVQADYIGLILFDHTYGMPGYGTYLSVVDGLGDAQFPAVLVGPTMPSTGSDCSMSVYVLKESVDVNGSIEFGLRNGTDPFRTSIASATVNFGSSRTITQWIRYSYHIGSLPAGFQVFIKAVNVTSRLPGSSFSIDDIMFEHCQPNFLSNVSSVSCDFENGWCNYFNDYTKKGEWLLANKDPTIRKVGPEHDHTTGSGYFTYVNLESGNQYSEVSAKLVTGLLDPGDLKNGCLSFYYHTFGTIIKLDAYIIEGNVSILIFVHSKTENSWQLGQASIQPSGPFQISFEGSGTMVQYYGHIALDDIILYNTPCPITTECNFESDMCGYMQSADDQMDWFRIHSGFIREGDPVFDHTSINKDGHYIKINVDGQQPGDRAILVSPMYSGQPGLKCLTFWYFVDLSKNGSMEVFYWPSGLASAKRSIWTSFGSFPTWMLAQATINVSTTNYKISLEGIVPSVDATDYSVDDILIEDKQCPPVGSCDFERDTCGFTADMYAWARNRGQLSAGDPPVDHTTGTSRGFFMSIHIKQSGLGNQLELRSQWINNPDSFCLTFWYFVNLASAKGFNIRVSTSTLHTLFDRRPILELKDLQPDEWQKVKLNFSMAETYYFVIAGVTQNTNEMTLAIDDIMVTGGLCDERIASTMQPPDTQTFPPSNLDCAFDSLCQWTQGSNDSFDWLITSKSPMKFSARSYDHTSDNDQGSFVMTNPPTTVTGQLAQLVSPALEDLSKGLCFKFWYFMSGPSAGSLNIRLLKDSNNSTIIWHREGEQSEDWLMANIFVTPAELASGHPQKVQIVIENILASEYPEDIRIDDVTANYGPCIEDLKNCHFESNDLCGFTQDLLDNGDWILSDGQKPSNTSIPGPMFDHTYGTSYGHYLYIEGSKFKPSKRAGVISKTMGPVQNFCLRFYYHMYGEDMGTLSVKLFTEEGDVTLIWSREGNSGDTWRSAHTKLDSDVNFQVAFEAAVKSSQLGNIAIDDVSILSRPCPQPATCDFENDLCTYQNVQDADDFDWLRHSGPTVNVASGPSRDHTTNTSNGHYIYTLNALRHQGKSARLVSEILPQSDGSCLSFFYHMQGAGTLLVWLDFNMNQLLATVSEDTGDQWKAKFINITTDADFVIVFESQILIEGLADTALDDITYTPGLCSVAMETQKFICRENGKAISLDKKCNFIKDCVNGSDEVNCGNCTFEHDKCGYRDVSEGSFHWIVSSNHTMRSSDLTNGLGNDHTHNSPDANMLYVDSLSGREVATAVIESPLLHSSYRACKLQFYYKFSKPLAGDISVALKFDMKPGLHATSFFQNRVYNLDSWHLAEVDIGYVAEPFNILIIGKKSFLSQGTIAIDDISLVDCSPPSASPLECALNQMSSFKCANGYCVDEKVVCDLTQDCGDGTDELGCDGINACTVEESLCNWQQDSYSGFSWKLGSGINQDAPVTRDHTLGTDTGHYLYMTSSPAVNNKAGTVAQLVSPTFQSTTSSNKTCQLTMYYFMLNNLNNTLTLSVDIRTAIGGYKTRLFTRQRGDFSGWERYVIPIVSAQNFQVIIETIPGFGIGGQASIALDDLVFSKGCIVVPSMLPTPNYTPTTSPVTPFKCFTGQHQCPDGQCISAAFVCDMKTDCSDGSDETDCGPCEFETGSCGWYSTSTGNLDWAVSTPDLMGKVGPSVDVTFNNATGHYLYVKTAYGLSESRATITSGSLPAIISTCTVRLQYYVNPAISGYMTLSTNFDGMSTPLTTVKVDPLSSSGWQGRTFSFFKNLQEGSQLVLQFQAQNLNGSQNIAAIDSIQFHGCSKREEAVSLDCSFDFKDLCQWKQSSKDVFDWIFSGGDVFTPNGPKRDHSTMIPGLYLLAKSQNRHIKDTAGIVSPQLPPSGLNGQCLSFWYYMNGADIGSLRVETYSDKVNTIIFERIGSLPNHWIQALVTIRSLDNYALGIKAEVTGGYYGDIAIDDIHFNDGTCSSPNECMFEDGNFCDWYEKASDTVYWDLGSKSTGIGSTPSIDHTLETQDGHFAYVQTMTNGTATLRSTLRITSTPNMTLCVQFWYHMVSEKPTQLNIDATFQDGQTRTFESLHGPSEDLWRKASVPIQPITGVYELQISAIVQGGFGHVAIDDLLLQDGSCPPPGSCSFEQDMCSFTAMHSGGSYEWVLHSDNALSASPNSFLLIQASNSTNISDAAILLSEVITNSLTKQKCLQFSVQLMSNETGHTGNILNIYTRHVFNYTKMLVGILDTFTSNKWSVYQVTFEVSGDFEFLFEAVFQGGSYAGLALDNIYLKDSCDAGATTVQVSQTTKCSSSSTPATTTTHCPGSAFCQSSSKKCVQICDGIKDCDDGSDEVRCSTTSSMVTIVTTSPATSTSVVTTEATSGAGNQGTKEQSRSNDNNTDSWKLPVGIVVGFIGAAIVTIIIILFVRHKRKRNFQKLENGDSELMNQTLSNPAYMYGADNPTLTSSDDTSEFPTLKEVDYMKSAQKS